MVKTVCIGSPEASEIVHIEALHATPRRLRLFAGVLLTTIALFFAMASSASALSFGLNFSSFTTNEDDWHAVGHSGANVFRMNATWKQVADAGNWREGPAWEQTYDKYFELAANNGVTILPDLYGRKTDAALHQFYLSNEWNEWLEFVWTFVQRYGRGGSFWVAHPTLPYKPATIWEVWNEPNLKVNNPGEVINPKKYAEFLIATSNTIKAAQDAVRKTGEPNDIQVLHGGLLQPDGMNVGTFLAEASKVSGFASSFNGLSLHPYAFEGDRVAGVASNVAAARSALSTFAGSAKTIWVTELGWPVSGTGKPSVTPNEQAELLTGAFNWLKSNASSYKIELATWYFYRDRNISTWDYHTGLRDEYGNYRPSWWAYQQATGAALWPVPNTAVQIDSGYFDVYSPTEGAQTIGLKMAPGTSPSIAALPNGSYVVALQTSSGYLDIYSPTEGTSGTGLKMAPGTSPSIAALPNGSYVVALQIESGYFDVYSPTEGAQTIGLLMAKGTSPSIATRPNGSYVVALQISSGYFDIYSPAEGAQTIGLGMAPGTSPSITGLANGSYAVALQTNGGYLDTYSPAEGAQGIGLLMAKGTSPSIATRPNGSYVVALQISSGYFDIYSPAEGAQTIGLGMAPGTSPSITSLGGTSHEVALQTNGGFLDTYSPIEGAIGIGLGMAKGTSPSISSPR